MSAEEAKAYGIIDEIFVGKDSLISIAKAAEEKEPKETKETKERVPVAAR
jgi:enoyl-CoA hydratase/carnithine racemase